ncbi:uncharacterized protein LOC129222550 [Uloborus diversus]|uniref:uncharacterized protein LOC129222550 n=1 Tax=Uloborus diversus TaxID=327109 RepID=UPI002409302B|nr:uncharacterized protein LOC129222550 [Uloborus diversus]
MAMVDSSTSLLLNEDLISLPLHLEKATLASVLGVCAHDSSKTLECSWNNKGKVRVLYEETENHLNESMEVDSESMDKCEPSLKVIVEKFSKEGSNYFKYIPDTELVSLLRLALRCKTTVSEKESCTKNADTVLYAVLSSSFSDVFMMNLLKKLNCEETLAILQILLSLLKNPDVDSLAVDSKPSDYQVFSWTCLVIQSHMETLLLSKDKEIILLLKELNKCLIEKMEEYEDFERIRNFLLLSKNSFPKDNARKKYTIENLE